MRTSVKGLHMIALKEAIVPAPYLDAVGVWTFGVGHTKMSGDPDPASMDKGNPEDIDDQIDFAVDLFKEQIRKYEDAVNEQVTIPLKQHEFDALVSFHFNTGGIYSASGVGLLNKGKKRAAWDRSFSKWVKGTVNGRKVTLRGLVDRRKKEEDLFFNGVYDLGNIPVFPVSSNNKPIYNRTLKSVTFEEFRGYFNEEEKKGQKIERNHWLLDLIKRLLGAFK